jgi:two-component system response regulator PilR (NtrC family)
MSERLLIVDDDPEIRGTFRSFFEGAGFRVDAAASLAEARDALLARRYAAVIADVSLSPQGDTDGLTLASRIRNAYADPPVLILTDYGSTKRAAEAAQVGADAFLHKPVSLVWLEGLVRARIGARGAEVVEPCAAPA